MNESEGDTFRLPLLKSLRDLAKSGAKLDASIVTTYAFNGLFYEEVLLRAFERAGSRLNIVLVDAAQLAESMGDPLRRTNRAGGDYLLVPIKHIAAFHPKIVALLSEKQAFLALGSHNATDAGFSHNEELTAFWGVGRSPPPAVLRDAVEYALHWLQTAEAVPVSVLDVVTRRLRSLMPTTSDGANEELTVVASLAGACLWDHLRVRLAGTVRRVWVVGPYFDADLSLLKAIDGTLAPQEILVGIQPGTAVLSRPDLAPPSVRFVDASAMGTFWSKADEVGFAHGKALAVETTEGLVVCLGSANPTGAAWLQQTKWNAEANLCLTGASAAVAFSALGFNLLTASPSLAASTLATIADRSQELRRQEHAAGPPSGPPVLCGAAVEEGIFLPGFKYEDLADVGLVSTPGTERPVDLDPVEGGSLIRLGDGGLSGGLYQLRSQGLTVAFILINDEQALRTASLPRDSARILDHLGALDSGAGFTELLDLLDKHVLSTTDVSPNGPSRPANSGEQDARSAADETPFGPRGVSLPLEAETGSRRPRLNDGLIADIISALIRALGAPPPLTIDGDARDLDEGDTLDEPSSDQLARNLDAETERSEIDWPRLVTACRKRLTVMIKKLEARMVEAGAGVHGPSWALGRLVVVLSLLQRLRVHPPQTHEAISGYIRPTSLVSLDQLRLAFGVAVCAMYGTGNLAAKLERSTNTRGAEERKLLDNLLLWFAREIGADCQRQAGEKAEATTLQARADVGLVAMSAAAHQELEPWAENRDPWLSIWDDALKVPPEWTSRQIAFGSILQNLRGAAPAASARAPQSGDLVQWAGERDLPWVLASIKGHKAVLVEPAGNRGAEKKVLLTSLRAIDVHALTRGPAQQMS